MLVLEEDPGDGARSRVGRDGEYAVNQHCRPVTARRDERSGVSVVLLAHEGHGQR